MTFSTFESTLLTNIDGISFMKDLSGIKGIDSISFKFLLKERFSWTIFIILF